MLSDVLPVLTYEGAGTPGASVDARAKLIVAMAGTVAVVLATDPWQLLSLTGLVAAGILLSRLPPATLWRNLRAILIFAVIGGAVLVLTTGGRSWILGPFHVSQGGLALAARVTVQLLLLLLITTLVTFTTSPFDIAAGLRRLLGFLRHLRIPIEDMTTMLTIAITFVPIMTQEVDRFLTARAARGVGMRRLGMATVMGDLLAPLIESNLQRGEELALALDTRLYGYGPRTHRHDRVRLDGFSAVLILVVLVWAGLSLALL
ncbi:MAG TPA: energy-coupling factor transporter transmembrane component T [Chloroflexota bacterium]|nr:energy-coupling factor transporter transmembrane component T [Chloroflexota bacterium]